MISFEKIKLLLLPILIGVAVTANAQQAKDSPETNTQSVEVEERPEEKDDEDEKDDPIEEKTESEDTVKVARPVTSDPVQVYGWMEKVTVTGVNENLVAKLDTGAQTSSIHAENQQIFERDGKKWVKFVVTDTREEGAKRYEMEAPLVRIVSIKEPGGAPDERNVVRLSFKIGERSIKTEFTLKDRNNMSCAVLIGRTTIKTLGWVDSSRTYLADDKILR